MIEIWKDIEGYEGLYQISNMGNVKSLERITSYADGRIRKFPSVKLVPAKIKGYNTVVLKVQKRKKQYLVHRLVAQAFLPNPEGKPQVNHINTVRTDNRVWVNEDGSIDYDKSNLEWCTPKENVNNPLTLTNMRRKHNSQNYKGAKHHLSKSVLQFTSDNNIINLWENISEVERILNISSSLIVRCCKRKQYNHTAGGYKWRYLDDYLADWWEEEMEKGA